MENTNNQAWSGRGKLENLVAELDRQKDNRIDFVADCRSLECVPDVAGTEDGRAARLAIRPKSETLTMTNFTAGGRAAAEFFGVVANNEMRLGELHKPEYTSIPYPLNEAAFGQAATKSEPAIPVRYARKLVAANPGAAAELFNGTFCRVPERRLFRILDGECRAVLSDKYRVLDHYDVAFSALETVREHGGEVLECSLDSRRMRLKFVCRTIWDELNALKSPADAHRFLGSQKLLESTGFRGFKADDFPGGSGTVHPVVEVGNSETGEGSHYVKIGILHAVCVNFATIETAIAGIHLGGRLESGIYTDETRSAESKAIFLKSRDAVAAAFKPESFRRLVDSVRGAGKREITSATAAVDLVASRLELTPDKRDSILGHFLLDYQANALGLASAVTRAAQDDDDPETAGQYEAFAGELMREPARMLAGIE